MAADGVEELLPCTCCSDDLEPYCPQHTPLPGESDSAATPSLPRRSYQVEPFYGRPDGSKTWAVRELLVTPHGYFLRRIVSFHKTFTAADRQREKMTLREREGSWGEPYEEAMPNAE